MPNTIRLRRGSGAPTAGSFVEGEPAWDSTNGRLYVKNAAGTMVQIGGSGSGAYTVSGTAPSTPANGDRWFDTSSGIEYAYLNDGNSSQWVETGAPGIGPQGPQGAASDVTLAGANAFTGANTFTNSTGQLFRQAATQDAVLLRGRAGGTTSLNVELVPTTLTASRTLTLPDVSGTVITTGDSGTITGTMITDATITDTEIASNAAIATSKLASFTAGQVLLGNATGVPTATTLSGDVTINSSGVTAIGAGVIVDSEVSATAAIAGTKIAPNFGGQLIQSSQSNQALSLTGSLNAATTANGLLSVGTLGFSGARMGANFTSAQTSYYQVVLQNTSSNAGASTDFVVCNNSSTDSTFYGNFGINSSAFTGSSSLSLANATYLTATSGDLVIGTTTANSIRFVYGSDTVDAIVINAGDVTFGDTIKPRAGTATAGTAPLQFTSGTVLSAAVAGAVEYDGTFLYATPTTTSGRGHVAPRQTFRLTGAGSNIGGTIADFYGATSAINLAATSVYDIEFFPYFQKNTAGTVTWTLTASSAPTVISGTYMGSPVSGIAAGTPITGYAGSRAATTAAFAATASVTNNAFMAFSIKVQVVTNAATTFTLRVTCGAGTVTPQAGSFYTVRQIAGTTGSFA